MVGSEIIKITQILEGVVTVGRFCQRMEFDLGEDVRQFEFENYITIILFSDSVNFSYGSGDHTKVLRIVARLSPDPWILMEWFLKGSRPPIFSPHGFSFGESVTMRRLGALWPPYLLKKLSYVFARQLCLVFGLWTRCSIRLKDSGDIGHQGDEVFIVDDWVGVGVYSLMDWGVGYGGVDMVIWRCCRREWERPPSGGELWEVMTMGDTW